MCASEDFDRPDRVIEVERKITFFENLVRTIVLLVSISSLVVSYFIYTTCNKNFEALNFLLVANNSTDYSILEYEQRTFHYAAGHDYKTPVFFCPECYLIADLVKRREEIYNEMIELSEFVKNNPDSPLIEEKNDKIEQLSIEEQQITKHIYRSDDNHKQKIKSKKIEEKKPIINDGKSTLAEK